MNTFKFTLALLKMIGLLCLLAIICVIYAGGLTAIFSFLFPEMGFEWYQLFYHINLSLIISTMCVYGYRLNCEKESTEKGLDTGGSS